MWRLLVALIRLPITLILIPWFIFCTLAILLSIPIIFPFWIVSMPFVILLSLLFNKKEMIASHLAVPNTGTAASFIMIRNLWLRFWKVATGARLDHHHTFTSID